MKWEKSRRFWSKKNLGTCELRTPLPLVTSGDTVDDQLFKIVSLDAWYGEEAQPEIA